MKTINEYLNGNTYPGRGVLIGKSADNAHYVAAYFIMGRSVNSVFSAVRLAYNDTSAGICV